LAAAAQSPPPPDLKGQSHEIVFFLNSNEIKSILFVCPLRLFLS
jgi:hypothetical protein